MNYHLRKALGLLQKAFIINRKVKKDAYCTWYDEYWEREHTEVHYGLRNHMYMLKSQHVEKAIELIRKYQLPIKYGKNDGVIYFEYLGRQVSFHDPHEKVNCKKFNGEWNGIHQTKSPFSGLLSRA